MLTILESQQSVCTCFALWRLLMLLSECPWRLQCHDNGVWADRIREVFHHARGPWSHRHHSKVESLWKTLARTCEIRASSSIKSERETVTFQGHSSCFWGQGDWGGSGHRVHRSRFLHGDLQRGNQRPSLGGPVKKIGNQRTAWGSCRWFR